MKRILVALLGLGEAGVDAYMNTRARFFRNLVLAYLLLMFQWCMNYWDLMLVNVATTFVLMIYALYLWTHPAVEALMAGLQAARKENPDAPVVPLNDHYYRLYLAYIMLWLSIVSMFVTTLPFNWYLSFRESLGVTLVGLIFISVIAWMAFFKWTEITVYKKIIRTYAYVGFLICAWMLIPGSIKYYVTGLEFYGPAGTSETAKAVAKGNRMVNKSLDRSAADRFLRISKDMSEGKKISAKDDIFWAEMQASVERETLPAKISGGVETIAAAIRLKNIQTELAEARKDNAARHAAAEKTAAAAKEKPAVEAKSTPAVVVMQTPIATPEKIAARFFTEKWRLDMGAQGILIVDAQKTADRLDMTAKYPDGKEAVFNGDCSGNVCSGNMTYNGFSYPFDIDLSQSSGKYYVKSGEHYSFSVKKI